MTKERLSKLQKRLLRDIDILQKEKMYGVPPLVPILTLMPYMRMIKKYSKHGFIAQYLGITLKMALVESKSDFRGRVVSLKSPLSANKEYHQELNKVRKSMNNLQKKHYIKIIGGRFYPKVDLLYKSGLKNTKSRFP